MSVTDDRIAEAVRAAGDGAFAIGPDGTIVLWNTAAERLLGYSGREVMGRPCCDVFGGHDGDGNRLCGRDCHVRTLAGHREPVRAFDMRTRTKAGRPLWLNMSVVAVPAAADGPALTVHLVRDVTATKELLTLVHERLAAAVPSASDATAPAAPDLTRRELEVLRLLTHGHNTAAVAERLHVSRATVRNHVQNLFAKLGVHSRLEAVAYAARHRLF